MIGFGHFFKMLFVSTAQIYFKHKVNTNINYDYNNSLSQYVVW